MKMIQRQLKKVIRRRAGTSMVEFALVLPLLALLLFGIIQWGFIFGAYITVRNAASVGAREAIISSNNAASAALKALGPMLDASQGTATLVNTNITGGSALAITVTYPLPII